MDASLATTTGRVVVDGEALSLPPTEVARVGVTVPRVGEPLLAFIDPDGAVTEAPATWLPCRVRRRRGAHAVVESVAGSLHVVPSHRLARPMDPTALGRILGDAAARRRFDAQVATQRPEAPDPWSPAEGDAVVVRLGDAYLGARLLRVEEEARVLRLRFDDPDLRDRDVPWRDVVPATATPVETGDLALVAPTEGSRWTVGRVRRGGPNPRVETRDGRARDVAAGRLRSFVRRAPRERDGRGPEAGLEEDRGRLPP